MAPNARFTQAVSRFDAGGDWTTSLSPADLVLSPAACYPVYPIAAARGPLPKGGLRFDVAADCFRAEPSRHLDRLQSFRMREYVCIGSPDDVSDFRERWMVRAQAIARDLGLTFKVDYASDPFFGRVGQMKAVSQKQQSLKFELLVPLRSEEQPTACMSFNYHRDHFGTTWDITDANGEPAHTGCVAFGMDRLAVAMFHTHGTDPAKWPVKLREMLGFAAHMTAADLDWLTHRAENPLPGNFRNRYRCGRGSFDARIFRPVARLLDAGLRRQAAREVPAGYPRFGYMIDNDGVPAGVLLLLYSSRTRRRRDRDPLQPVELVCRAGVPQLRADADQDRAEEQGSHLHQYQPGDLDLADHRDAGLQRLLQRIVLLDAGAVARPAPA